MKCDIIANGIIKAATVTGVKVPIIIRLTGTNSSERKKENYPRKKQREV